jgi:methyltransferase
MSSTAAAYLILGFVTLQRLAELLLAERNRKRLMSRGASEHGQGHYPLIVAVHGLWLVALWWWAPGRPIDIALLLLFAVLQAGRLWVLSTLGDRWTTRIIVLRGAPLVTRGPYRFVNHPNYLIVILEIAVLPLVFGLWEVALAFSALNAAVLAIRIRAENQALASLAAAP